MKWYFWLVVAACTCNCINRYTHDGNEYAKCLVKMYILMYEISMKWALYKLALASFTAFPHTVGYMTILIVTMISVLACFLMMLSFVSVVFFNK